MRCRAIVLDKDGDGIPAVTLDFGFFGKEASPHCRYQGIAKYLLQNFFEELKRRLPR